MLHKLGEHKEFFFWNKCFLMFMSKIISFLNEVLKCHFLVLLTIFSSKSESRNEKLVLA